MQERIDYKKLNFQLATEILGGKNVVFTGRGFLVRGELMRLARQAGASVDSIVTRKCDILIVGEKPGSKLRKAKILGCDIITISDFRDILEGKIKKDKIEIDDILNIIEANFGLELPEDSLYYSRLVIHLKFFMQRVIKGESDDENFEKLIISAKSDINKKIGITLDSIERYLNEEFDYVLSEAERFYLLVHISRII